jgi:ABC-2 type transport system permease protein
MSPRNFHWSVRREIWENRSLYIVPLLLAVLILAGFIYALDHLAEGVRALAALSPAKQARIAATPYGLAAAAILFLSWLIGFFYALDALNGERRDRSILFWKSMPVSDLETVLAKASIPLVLLPIFACLVALATQGLLLALSTALLEARGIDTASLWAALPFLQMPVAMFYGMAVHALWFAPIMAWALFVSGLVRRAVFLWALGPFFAAIVVERIALGTQHVSQMLRYRFTGAMELAFKPNASKDGITTDLAQLDPVRFLSSPALWLGLLVAVALLAASVRLRRYREPI